MIDTTLLGQFADDLNRLAETLRTAQIEGSHTLSLPIAQVRTSYPSQALTGVEDWLKTAPVDAAYLYQFSVAPSVDVQALHQAFSQAKTRKVGNRAYARLQAPSSVLYVGSSSSLLARIKQHLGYGPQRTYAMQLSLWLPDLDAQLELSVWRFSPTTPKAVLQAIEDSLWAQQKPMLGRQGAR